MNKNRKSMIFLAIMFMMVSFMGILYVNFENDKPKIQAQEQQNLTPEQMANGVKSFIDTTTSNIRVPSLNP